MFTPSAGQLDDEGLAVTRIQVPIPANYGPMDSVRSLDFFLKRTAPMCSMSSPLLKELWTIVVPQASWRYAAVQDMLVALSMLDQYLSGSLPYLLVKAEYRSALQHYNKGIRALVSMPNPSVSCLLLAAVIAWAFEYITNQPDVAAMHARAALRIIHESDRGFPGLSAEDKFIIGCVEDTVRERNYIHAHGIRRCNRQLQQFQNLCDARRGLFAIVENVVQLKPVLASDIVFAKQAMVNWRASFEAYRYIGLESLKEKRSVYMAHNTAGTYIALLDPAFRTKDQDTQQRVVHHILNDVEHVVEYEDLANLNWILNILLKHIVEDPRVESNLYNRAKKLMVKLSA